MGIALVLPPSVAKFHINNSFYRNSSTLHACRIINWRFAYYDDFERVIVQFFHQKVFICNSYIFNGISSIFAYRHLQIITANWSDHFWKSYWLCCFRTFHQKVSTRNSFIFLNFACLHVDICIWLQLFDQIIFEGVVALFHRLLHKKDCNWNSS